LTKATGFILLLSLLLGACTTAQKAPVIDRTPVETKPEAVIPPPAKPPVAKDWRPDVYTVKKGDTLYSIGLEYGYDYKELAQANNIPPPYVIRVGQQLRLKDAKQLAAANAAKEASSTDNGVVVTPLNTEGAVGESGPPTTTTPPSGITPVLSEPKAIREPYSEKALLALNTPAKPAETGKLVEPTKAEVTKPVEPLKPDAMPGDDDVIEWGWPTNGKVVAGFNDASSGKGIDISGAQGQAVMAAAPGKVIYSGSDLRGYGKLVIIKHNKTYLSVYAHNNNILVKEGQFVSRGQKIAEMGNSDTDKVKLHFEIRQQGKSVDPVKYLPGHPG
jgi:lipoprotein NlpD